MKLEKLFLRRILLATLLAAAMAFLYYFSQVSLLSLVRDAQAGIAVMFVRQATMRLFVGAWIAALLLLLGWQIKKLWPLVLCGACGISAAGGFTALSIVRAVADEKALAAVSNIKTSPHKLEVLAHYETMYWGTELQNRIAQHQHTSPKTFWTLYHDGHDGTHYCIAQNLHAPVGLLLKLAEHDQESVRLAAKNTLQQLKPAD